MFKLKKKNIWIYLIILIGIYFSYLYFQTISDYNILKKEEEALNEKIKIEQQKKSELTKANKTADSKETVESLARSDLNYLKEDEILFIDGENAK